MIRKTIPAIELIKGEPAFEIPKGYRFVADLPAQFAKEYWLFPFNYLGRFLWWFREKRFQATYTILSFFIKVGVFHISEKEQSPTSYVNFIGYIWRNRGYAKEKKA